MEIDPATQMDRGDYECLADNKVKAYFNYYYNIPASTSVCFTYRRVLSITKTLYKQLKNYYHEYYSGRLTDEDFGRIMKKWIEKDAPSSYVLSLPALHSYRR